MAMISTLLLIHSSLFAACRLDQPLPPSWNVLDAIAKKVGAASTDDRLLIWRQSQPSWVTTWSAETFGIGKTLEDPSPFRFRLAPDSPPWTADGKRSPLIESYRNGMPLFGTVGSGHARPLGFRYGGDGLCTNVTVFVTESGEWRRVRLSRRETTIIGRILAINEYAAGEVGPPLTTFGAPWIRVTAQGYGDYWIDQNLNCVGPFGICGRLIPEERDSLLFLISGGYAKLKPTKDP